MCTKGIHNWVLIDTLDPHSSLDAGLYRYLVDTRSSTLDWQLVDCVSGVDGRIRINRHSMACLQNLVNSWLRCWWVSTKRQLRWWSSIDQGSVEGISRGYCSTLIRHCSRHDPTFLSYSITSIQCLLTTFHTNVINCLVRIRSSFLSPSVNFFFSLTKVQAITAEGKQHAIAIGKMTMSAEEM